MVVPKRFADASLRDFNPDSAVSMFMHSMLDLQPVEHKKHIPGAGFTDEIVKAYDMQGQDGLVIVGPVGAGKTHMAAAIYNALTVPRIFASALEIVEAAKEAVTSGEPQTFHNANRVLVLDDLSAIRPTDFAVDTLSKIIRCRYDEMLPTVITTHTSHDGLAEIFGGAIASRILEFGPVVKLGGHDRR